MTNFPSLIRMVCVDVGERRPFIDAVNRATFIFGKKVVDKLFCVVGYTYDEKQIDNRSTSC